jgi:hypothetical protein
MNDIEDVVVLDFSKRFINNVMNFTLCCKWLKLESFEQEKVTEGLDILEAVSIELDNSKNSIREINNVLDISALMREVYK